MATSRSKRANAILAVLGDRPVAYHPGLAKALTKLNNRCGAKEALWISQMLYWDGKGKLAGGWIYKTRDEWQDELGLSRAEQETVRKHLRDLGLQEEKLVGMPARMAYRIEFDLLGLVAEMAYCDTEEEEQRLVGEIACWRETIQQDGGNPANREQETSQQDGEKLANMMAETPPRSETTTETTPQTTKKEEVHSLEQIWSQCLEELELQMTKSTFQTWFHGSRLVALDPRRAVIACRDQYCQDWLANRLRNPISRTLKGVSRQEGISLEFIVQFETGGAT